jgi:hypothetical protein
MDTPFGALLDEQSKLVASLKTQAGAYLFDESNHTFVVYRKSNAALAEKRASLANAVEALSYLDDVFILGMTTDWDGDDWTSWVLLVQLGPDAVGQYNLGTLINIAKRANEITPAELAERLLADEAQVNADNRDSGVNV